MSKSSSRSARRHSADFTKANGGRLYKIAHRVKVGDDRSIEAGQRVIAHAFAIQASAFESDRNHSEEDDVAEVFSTVPLVEDK